MILTSSHNNLGDVYYHMLERYYTEAVKHYIYADHQSAQMWIAKAKELIDEKMETGMHVPVKLANLMIHYKMNNYGVVNP